MSVKAKLTIRILLIVVITILAICVVSTAYFTKILTEQVVNDEMWRMRFIASSIKNFQRNIEKISMQLVYNLATEPAISEILVSLEPEQLRDIHTTMKPLLDVIVSREDNINSIYLISNNDYLFSTYSRSYYPRDVFGEMLWYDHFKESGENQAFSELYTLSKYGGLYISYISKCYDISGKTYLGDLLLNIPIQSLYAQMNLLEDDEVMLLHDGDILVQQGDFTLDESLLDDPRSEYAILDGNRYALVSKSIGFGFVLVKNYPMSRVFAKLQFIVIFFAIIAVLSAVGIPMVIYRLIRKSLQPIQELIEASKRVGEGDYLNPVSIETKDEFQSLGESFNEMMESIQMAVETRKKLSQMEIDRLLLQINPHFLTNTLASILFMAKAAGNDNIVKYTQSFTELLSSILYFSAGGTYLRLADELQNVKNYIVLQQYRYPRRFHYTLEAPASLDHAKVPAMILQPLVENAFFHGLLSVTDYIGSVKVSARREANRLLLIIEDNGVGMREEKLQKIMEANNQEDDAKRTRIGIHNIRERLDLMYGGQASITVSSWLGKGTTITIAIPYALWEQAEEPQEGESL